MSKVVKARKRSKAKVPVLDVTRQPGELDKAILARTALRPTIQAALTETGVVKRAGDRRSE